MILRPLDRLIIDPHPSGDTAGWRALAILGARPRELSTAPARSATRRTGAARNV